MTPRIANAVRRPATLSTVAATLPSVTQSGGMAGAWSSNRPVKLNALTARFLWE